jgi:DNA repair exonuclease SbcCD ATPase subunit
MRQRELRRILATRREALASAQAATDDVLVSLAERGRSVLSQKDSYSKLLGAVIAAEHALRERDGALAAETDAHKQKTAGLDARIAEQETELARLKAEEQACEDEFARVDATRQRAEAKIKRVDIELRSALARAQPAGVPGTGGVTDEINAAVAARTAERDARHVELEQAMPAVAEATQKLAVARRKSAALEQTVLVARNERAAIEADFKKRGAAHGAEVAKAQKEVRAALAVLGRTAAADLSTFGAEWSDTRRQLVALDQTTASRDDDVMLHVMALDAYDAEKVRTGLGLILLGVGLLAALALVPLVIRAATPTPPVPVTIPMP